MSHYAFGRQIEHAASGVRLQSLRLKPPFLVCPSCGCLHPGRVARRLAWMPGFTLLVIWAWSLVVPAAANAGAPELALLERYSSKELAPGALSVAVSPPDMAKAESEIGMALVLAVPNSAVVWNRRGSGTPLWDQPGGQTIAYLGNGEWVELKDEWSGYGGVPFGAVVAGGEAGWVDMRRVHRLPIPDGDILHVFPVEGVNLYSEPQGDFLLWLPPGTPLLLEDALGEDSWLSVKLLVGGQSGWLPAKAVQAGD